jgi:prophage regulatory protein
VTAPRLLTAAEVEARTTITASTWYAWHSRKRPDVPQPIRVGGRRLAWVEAEVDAWLASQAEDRPGRVA